MELTHRFGKSKEYKRREMTKVEINKNWEKVLDLLAKDVTSVSMQTWFAPLKPIRVNEREGKLILSTYAGGDMLISYIETRYKSVLAEAIKAAFRIDLKPVIMLPEEIEEKSDYVNPFTDELYLNPKYNFNNFVVGSNNRLAHAVCLAVAEGYSKEYNPLFLYGEAGLGKTHLMHAIGQFILSNNPRRKVLYVSSEMFTNELIKAISEKKNEAFRNKYRTVDILLFDDVQFVQGRESTEEEVFNTFDTLYHTGKQIVFSSDRPPKELGNIPERLRSRFTWGMVADIQTPDYETRMAILTKKAEIEGIVITENIHGVLDVIAQNIQTNIRELEGAFTRVLAHAGLTNEKITKDFAKSVLNEVFTIKKKEITPSFIKKTVASFFGIKITDMESNKRARNFTYPRHIAIYLIREKTNYSLPKIGDEFGGRDHSTISYSYEKICEEIGKSAELRSTIQNIERLLSEE
ncbi:MAG: chromosomal replication initiator protein DnaA [Clostridia bacterium]|nr:chromosomal replication initiator protein DnaA [Clostridia bacterium]